MTRAQFLSLLAAPAALPADRSYVVVAPGTHPGIVFSASELPALRRRASGAGMAADAWSRVKRLAAAESNLPRSVKQAVGRDGITLAERLEAMALIYQVEQDQQIGRRALAIFESILGSINPVEFHNTVDSDFFATEHWPKSFAHAWDWLQPLIPADRKPRLLAALEAWSAALYQHTESWWWRDAGYNCGAIPVGAHGVLLSAIQGESRHPDFAKWHSECFRKISRNYFPETWRSSGICNEGPGYAHYHRNPTLFANAVRRLGGPDIIAQSGAVNAMHYLRHQWMPQGGCGPVGDNTSYGRRVFQPIYLFGIRELGDAAGLWTFEKYADLDRINPTELFLCWPDSLKPVSPATLDLPTSHYFEIDPHRAGYLFARNRWDDERAHWFAFTTRYENANHTHYDPNGFLFTAFGEQFATHENVYGYSHPHHGADIEHNIVIVGEGGMPANDRPNSAGDDGSLFGYMTGVVAGDFADFARGDARRSYADRSIKGSQPAVRAERAVLFAKQGPNPYVVVADDIQRSQSDEDYHWQWYTRARQISGRGTFAEPFALQGEHAQCRIAFHTPDAPAREFKVVTSEGVRTPFQLGLLRVSRKGIRVRYAALAAANQTGQPEPQILRGPDVQGTSSAASFIVKGDGFEDLIVWQSEEKDGEGGVMLTCGQLKTDALMAMVRTNASGQVTGYVLGEGRALEFNGKPLARSQAGFSVSAGEAKTMVAGPRRPRQNQPPLPARGEIRLPAQTTRLWVDGNSVRPSPGRDGLVKV
ncbi:MAG: hypothetical protein IH602_12620 [Bryobacteraceae bacterium]|nr:hypothetical protein [Bryobacteraceae bacterium]